ncbi:MAG: UDP-N-acetylmuramoyl-L-alanyl-D-glutamate--2,6-diaminopimelate ligase, partial [Candidatus Competibacterales bacterium]|nr:UDP-N-acetylmuramoyl-L-alanyl-D-glutamate--2,6-diaminopimelate ligase [Candidatus Competibacterales bacterium]
MTSAPTPTLASLLQGLASVPPAVDCPVTGLASDSRRVTPGDLFLALRGHHHHGLAFLPGVRAAGAAAVAWEPPAPAVTDPGLPLVEVPQLSRRIGVIASRFHGEPGRGLDLVGITGTDGKTSTAWYLAQALHRPDAPCGLLGTLGQGTAEVLGEPGLTTPEALSIWAWLAQLRERGARRAVMEVSSHALDQGRSDGMDFAVAVLKNLGRDHLDYHCDADAYAAAKRRLFTELEPRRAVLNHDDAFGRRLAEQLGEQAVVYGFAPETTGPGGWVRGENLRLMSEGLRLDISSRWGRGELASGLLGRFNAINLLAALATLLVLGLPLSEALARLGRVGNAPGRMERHGGGGRPLVVIDYAHTPQALEQALRALREHGRERLWCVFGCGGERDTGKRALMAAAAECWAERVVITD